MSAALFKLIKLANSVNVPAFPLSNQVTSSVPFPLVAVLLLNLELVETLALYTAPPNLLALLLLNVQLMAFPWVIAPPFSAELFSNRQLVTITL